MKIYRFLFLAAIALFVALPAAAQNTTSPYSKFGYGLLNDYATSAQRAMGGVGYAMNGGRQINVMNPASYAAIDSLTFLWDMGIDFTGLKSKENATNGKSFGGGLDYMTMQFPITKIMGGSIGLVPFSSVGYAFGSDLNAGTEARNGSGGINQLYAGYSIRPFKGLSIGANIGYLFGTSINDTYVYTSTGSTSLFERIMKVRSWNTQIGIQYNYQVNKSDKATIGLVYSPKKSLHGHTWGAYYDVTNDSKQDTIGYSSLNGNYYTPNSYGLGLGYTFGNKLNVEADFTYQDWAKADFLALKGFDSDNLKFDNRWKVAAGLQYVPDYRGSYFRRVNYRFGAYYNHDYINVRGNNVREYGASMGFGFPTPGSKTLVNIGFEYKHRSSSPVNYISENYFNITVGINFNEMWFWQNKIR